MVLLIFSRNNFLLVTCLTIPYSVLYYHRKIEPNALIEPVKIKVVLIIAIYKLIAWTDSIFVTIYDDRMDFPRVVVFGADGTPYQNDIFFFDINFPFQSLDRPPVSTLLQLYDLKLKLLNIFHGFFRVQTSFFCSICHFDFHLGLIVRCIMSINR